MVDEKDIEYGKIFHRQLDVIKEQEKLLDHKDREISEKDREIERLRGVLQKAATGLAIYVRQPHQRRINADMVREYILRNYLPDQ